MANKTFNTRVKNKRDTAANWEAVATTFQPLDGELIIVDTAAGKTRFKVGRYDTAKGRLLYYNEIPFTDEYLYNDLNESQGKIYDKLKGIDDKSIIEMTLESVFDNTKFVNYRIGLWQFSKTGFYKLNIPKRGTTATQLFVYAQKTKEDGTTPEDPFSQDNLLRISALNGDRQVESVLAQVDYTDTDTLTVYKVQFLNAITFPGTLNVNAYNKTTQKWDFTSVTESSAKWANNATQVSNALTLTKGDTTTKFDGSTAQTVSIPAKTSELTNDSDFTTQTDLDNLTNTVVSYNAQENITDEQKAQARTNIGAISSSDLVQASSTKFGLLKPAEMSQEEANLVGKYQQCYQLVSTDKNSNGTIMTRSAVQQGQLTANFILNSCFWGDTYSDMCFLSASSDVKTTLGLVDSDFPIFGYFGGVAYSSEIPTYTISIITQTGKHGTFTCKRSTGEMSAITWTSNSPLTFDEIMGEVVPFINGNFVAYGGEQSLTDEQKKLACDNIGARSLMCTITGDGTDTSPYVCDKTYDEISAAVDNGQIPYCIHPASIGKTYGDKDLVLYYLERVVTPYSSYHVFRSMYRFSTGATEMAQDIYINQNGNVTIVQGTVYSVLEVNGKTGNVTLKTSDLENDSGYVSTIDDALSDSSTSPVQNKVVKAAIDDLQASIDSKSMDKITNGDVTLACGGEDGTEYLTLTSTTDGSESQFYGNKWYLLFDSDHSTPSIQFYAPNSNKICGGISGSYGKLEGTTDILHDINFYTTTGSTYLTAKNNIILTTTTTDNYAGGDIEVKTQSPIGKFKIQMPTTVPAPTEDMSPATKKYVDDQITTVNNQLGGLTGAMHFIGKAAVDITDGSTTDPQIANYTTKEKGDVILGKDDHKEFVWNGAIWEELGDEGSYALKTTTINGKALSDNITLTASDVGAASASAIETMQAAIDSKPSAADAVYTATAESTDGVAYTATVSGIDSLTIGASFIMIPNKASTSKAPTLNVNGLGAKPIRRRLSSLTTSLQQGYSTNWIALNKPFTVVYDGTAWVIEGLTKTDGADVYGAVAQATADAKGNNIADTYATIAMLQSLLPKVTTITLTSNWVGDASPYYQDIALSCVTETSIVDLQPTPEQLNSWQDDGLAFTTLSGNGTVRVYVAGGKPSSAISVQVRVQEVTVI